MIRKLVVGGVATVILAFQTPLAAASGSGSFEGVDAASSDQVWAVGSVQGKWGHPRTLIEGWNGARWVREKSPNRGWIRDGLVAVDMVNTHLGWAVGSSVVGDRVVPLISRWNGFAWKLVPGPGLSGDVAMHDVAARRGDVWVVGSHNGTAIALRRHASRWRSSRLPAVVESLEAVYAVGRERLWAVGSGFDRAGAVHASYALLWNGRRWITWALPMVSGSESCLAHDIARAPSGVYAVGECWIDAGSDLLRNAYVVRFHRGRWEIEVRSPTAQLNGVAVTSAGSVWAVGWRRPGDRPFAIRRAAGHWEATPIFGSHGWRVLNDVTATKNGAIWAVGHIDEQQPIALRWTGTGWRYVETAPL
jgi:hypothetical protein